MLTDLYLSKESRLIEWMKRQGFFTTSQVMEWGTHNYYNRSINTKSDLLKQGLIRKLSDDEKLFRNFKTKQGVYQWVGR